MSLYTSPMRRLLFVVLSRLHQLPRRAIWKFRLTANTGQHLHVSRTICVWLWFPPAVPFALVSFLP